MTAGAAEPNVGAVDSIYRPEDAGRESAQQSERDDAGRSSWGD